MLPPGNAGKLAVPEHGDHGGAPAGFQHQAQGLFERWLDAFSARRGFAK